ncbi:hypothetical protein ACFRKD_05190 [Streptomyces niveus]|uniref:hypothetical protein n=1 Tax=Streptomyces niveus TaxID=193462 RepID=UPI0036B1E049
MTDRLTKACGALRVPRGALLDALRELSWGPVLRPGPHTVRALYEQVLEAVGELPLDTVQPGDISAAMQVRTGVLDVHVPPPSDALAQCIAHTVDDRGVGELGELARYALDRTGLTSGAATVACGREAGGQGALDRLAAEVLVHEIIERSPQAWGRGHADAVRAATYRSLADLADALLEVSESTPTHLDWADDDANQQQCASAHIRGTVRPVVVHRRDTGVASDTAYEHHPTLPQPSAWAWAWRLEPGPGEPIPHGRGPYPSALAARHAAECAVTALAAGRCRLEDEHA